ncbi:hypothetical protein ACFXI0_07875 [Kitasatospora indigofera]|uniref:hypothetical protein n=1 Tax=Kitasatospora indigofera TaxID=67307 RepID=UPI0036BB2734
MLHFAHCYAYEGAHCSCGATQPDGYQGGQPGPDLDLPPAPFAPDFEVPRYPVTDEESAALPTLSLDDFRQEQS